MNFTDLGFFETYTPEGDNPEGIIYFRNQAGRDFYDLVRDTTEPGHWFMVDAEGYAVACAADLSALAPHHARIIHAEGAADLAARFKAGDVAARLMWDGAALSFVTSVPDGEAVNAERARRLEAGSAFAVSWSAAPVPVTGRQFDQTVILALSHRAMAYKAAGTTEPKLTYRDAANVIHHLTPDQFIELAELAMNWVEAVMNVSWAMKDKGIPADFTDDKHWP